MEKDNPILFKPLVWSILIQLYDKYHTDPSWPQVLATIELLSYWFSQWETRNWLGTGSAFAIYRHGASTPIGYCTLTTVDNAYCPNELTVMEGGTYLAPEVRGTGVNVQVKEKLRRLAETEYHAQALVYAVRQMNQRALFSLRKLPIPTEEITLENAHQSAWERLLRRKIFEEQQPMHLFVQYMDCRYMDG